VARTSARADAARETVLQAAQAEAFKTTLALASAPASREVAIATRTAGNASDLLAQANGPLPVADLAALRQLVEDLRSDNAATLAAAQAAQSQAERRHAAAASELSELRARVDDAQGRLAAAFARENALANRWRNLVAGTALLGLVLALAIAGLVWFRIQTFGLQTAVARMIRAGDAAGIGSTVRSLLDPHLNRAEQDAIRQQIATA
jgi:hypothetical protein